LTPFTYQRPASLGDALAALAAGPGAKVLAGGQSLLLALKERQTRPAGLIAINSLPELQGVCQAEDGTLAVGPAMRYAALAKTVLPGWHAELAAVAGNLADRSVRNMGTVGGGVCQADPRFDMPAFMAGIGAKFILDSVGGRRVLDADAFFKSSGGTYIAADEILTCISLPALPAWTSVAFEKFCFRTFEAAIVNVAGAVALDVDGNIAKFRIAVGAIANAPLLASGVSAKLLGKSMALLDIEDVATKISQELLPIENASSRRQKYQAELTISLVKRVLTRLGAGVAAK
jgi:aerobic carbon-monoxide dehydrogenase medium subunit